MQLDRFASALNYLAHGSQTCIERLCLEGLIYKVGEEGPLQVVTHRVPTISLVATALLALDSLDMQ